MTFISSVTKYIFTILLVIAAGFSLYSAYGRFKNPCSLPISYEVGSFDKRFGVSQESFVNAAQAAEKAWEEKLGTNLFDYHEAEGSLALNLIYDDRQRVTNKLDTLDSAIDSGKGSYDTLKAQYNAQVIRYNEANNQYEVHKNAYEKRRVVYQKEVAYWNSRGGAPTGKYQELSAEKDALTAMQASLDTERKTLNNLADDTNEMADRLNTLAKNLNMNISQYNSVGKAVEREFDQGVYERDADGTRINIYQFETVTALVHVLTHEFGHALELDHSEDENSIMYYLNKNTPQLVTDADIQTLKKVCKIP